MDNHSDFVEKLDFVIADIRSTLIAKNKAYGDSALNPIAIFAKGNAADLIRVRIDDKLSRIKNGVKDEEDTVKDLIGYLLLLRMTELNSIS